MADVRMPRLSDSMEEGTILKWLKADGEHVAKGDGLADIETDKATETYEADADGTLTIVAGVGETLPVGAVIARIGEPVQQLTRTQQLVARRVAESKATVPDFTLQADIDMEGCVALRSERERLGGDAPVPSYEDMVVKACALALREHPRANARYKDARFELLDRINIGFALPAHGSIVVPTIFDADTKTLGEIARDVRALSERVRSETITHPELSGATFTVSSLGSDAVTAFRAIIHPPQAAILAIGAVAERAVARDAQVVVRHVMTGSLTCDHRILYGAEAAGFLARVCALLEQPGALLP